MSIDTYMMIKTERSVFQIARKLIEDYGLREHKDSTCLGGDAASVSVEPWNADDHDLIGGGFETADVFVTFYPCSSAAGFARENQMLASILRDTSGDACTQIQDGGPLDLLRVGTTVYLNPASVRPEDLTENGYVPDCIVIGIPPDLAPSIK